MTVYFCMRSPQVTLFTTHTLLYEEKAKIRFRTHQSLPALALQDKHRANVQWTQN